MSTRVKVSPGACGLVCELEISIWDKDMVVVKASSECERVMVFAERIAELSVMEAIAPVDKNVLIKEAAGAGCHSSCPVALAVIKGIEVEAGLAVPKEASKEGKEGVAS